MNEDGLVVLGAQEEEIVPPRSEESHDGSSRRVSDEAMDFTGAFGSASNAVNMIEVEQATADRLAKEIYEKRRAADAAALARVPQQPVAATATRGAAGRKAHRGISRFHTRTISSDPDSAVLEEAMDASSVLLALWERQRDDMSTPAQLELFRERAAAAAASPAVEGSDSTCVHSGSVCLYDPTKGYGFIAPDIGGPDIYFSKDAVEGWDAVAAAAKAYPNNEQRRRAVEEFPLYLIPGERVVFDVIAPEDQAGRGSKRVRAGTVRGEDGMLLITRALTDGKRMRGVVRQLNMDNCKGYIQAAAAAESMAKSDTLPVDVSGMNLLERAHTKGLVDASFTHPCAYVGGGGSMHLNVESLQRGTTVEYSILRDIDVKTGKAVAVCPIAVGTCEATPTSTNNDALPQGGGGAPYNRGGRRTENQSSVNHSTHHHAHGHQQQQQLLFDDGDAGTW